MKKKNIIAMLLWLLSSYNITAQETKTGAVAATIHLNGICYSMINEVGSENYYKTSLKISSSIPDVKGMAAMDAISVLENLGLLVEYSGNGKVKNQSLKSGGKIIKGATIKLELS